MELSQREVRLHHVERRSRRAGALLLRRQKIFERRLRRRQRLATHLANRAADPDSSRLVWETPAGPLRLPRARSRRSRISRSLLVASVRRDWRRSCFCLRDRCRRPPSGWQIRWESAPPDSVARARRPRGHLSTRRATSRASPAQEPAGGRSRIDRFGLGQRDEILAAVQSDDDTLCLVSRVDHDDSQRHFIGAEVRSRGAVRARGHGVHRREDQRPDRHSLDLCRTCLGATPES